MIDLSSDLQNDDVSSVALDWAFRHLAKSTGSTRPPGRQECDLYLGFAGVHDVISTFTTQKHDLYLYCVNTDKSECISPDDYTHDIPPFCISGSAIQRS